uniref:NADH-plastoquinone oxidoreductase subunit 5 n=1 Tax=Haemonchus placei TaxID=6290 RepID=A0A0N4X6J7_HAEPC
LISLRYISEISGKRITPGFTRLMTPVSGSIFYTHFLRAISNKIGRVSGRIVIEFGTSRTFLNDISWK